MFYYYFMKTLVRITTILIIIKQIISDEGHYINGDVPKYLKYSTNDLNATIIPINLKFNLSLSTILGTLLYALDSQKNQLILSLFNGIKERMKIEFRGSENYILLTDLCGCNPCRYRWLSFHIKIDNKLLKIKCNQEKVYKITYDEEIKLQEKYPDLVKSEQLIIYFINTPEYGESMPNNEQLEGCFKDALLNGKPMNFTLYPDDLPKCKKSCSNNPCNSGKCYETFSRNIICDCTHTFMNGKYCNSSMLKHPFPENEKLVITKFDFIKLSWNSIKEEVISLSNKNFSFSIQVKNGSLLAKYKENNSSQTIKGTLLNTYNTSTNNILFISFKIKSINLTLITTDVTIHGEFNVPRNISEENIQSWKLPKDGGEIDMVYKNDLSEYTWNTAFLSKYDKKKYGNLVSQNNDSPSKSPEKLVLQEAKFSKTCIFFFMEIVILGVSVVIWAIYLIKYCMIPKCSKNTSSASNSYSPVPPENAEIT